MIIAKFMAEPTSTDENNATCILNSSINTTNLAQTIVNSENTTRLKRIFDYCVENSSTLGGNTPPNFFISFYCKENKCDKQTNMNV